MSPNDTTDPIDEVLQQLTAAIGAVAPDVVDEVGTVDPDIDLFEEFGLDSMDRLTIMSALAASSGRPIPEQLYAHLTTVNRIRAHLR